MLNEKLKELRQRLKETQQFLAVFSAPDFSSRLDQWIEREQREIQKHADYILFLQRAQQNQPGEIERLSSLQNSLELQIGQLEAEREQLQRSTRSPSASQTSEKLLAHWREFISHVVRTQSISRQEAEHLYPHQSFKNFTKEPSNVQP